MACLKIFKPSQFHKKSFYSLLNLPHKSYKYCQITHFHRSSLLYVTGIELRMPSLSPTMTDGTIVKWIIQEGGPITPGDVVCDIQTDKAIVSFEVEEEGTLAKILVPENTPNVKVGTLIGLMVAPGEDWQKVEIPPDISPVAKQDSPSPKEDTIKETKLPSPPSQQISSTRGFFGPVVRNLIDKYGLDPQKIKSTGNRGVLLKEDVLKFIESNNLKPMSLELKEEKVVVKRDIAKKDTSSPNDYVDVELSNMRSIIAKRLTESKQNIPHAYMSVESNIDQILQMRSKMEKENRVSLNDFIIKAVASSLQEVPSVNVQWVNNSSVVQPTIDISVAVDTGTGLITPIVKNASSLRIHEISQEVKKLVEKAKVGKLKPEEFMGGTFTISNLGMFGIKEFTAIINPPQCAILAVGGGYKNLDIDKNNVTTMITTLCYDARAIEETQAAKFLSSLKLKLENPILML